jgi:nucleotide-binding universal stress UspA family protein
VGIKTILVGVSGGSASTGAIDTGLALARRLGAHVEGFHARIDERQSIVAYGDSMGALIPADLVERVAREAAEMATAARRLFDEAVSRHGLAIRGAAGGNLAEASASWHEETGHGPSLLARRARGFDLIVLGRSDRVIDEPHSAAVETAVLDSGRPVLLAPAQTAGPLGKRVVIGWNDTVAAVHALAAAVPIMQEASLVRLVTIGKEDDGLGALGALGAEHLAWHGIAASARLVAPVDGVGAGSQLLSTAREEGADLLVMGAYSRSAWREILFGGATREVVGVSLMPLLLAH